MKHFQRGDVVLACSKDEYNGLAGVVRGEDESDGCFEVELDGIAGLFGFLPSELQSEQSVQAAFNAVPSYVERFKDGRERLED